MGTKPEQQEDVDDAAVENGTELEQQVDVEPTTVGIPANSVQLHAVDIENDTSGQIYVQNVGLIDRLASTTVENEFASWITFDNQTWNATSSASIDGGQYSIDGPFINLGLRLHSRGTQIVVWFNKAT